MAIRYSDKLTYDYLCEMIQEVGAEHTIIDHRPRAGREAPPSPACATSSARCSNAASRAADRPDDRENPAKLLF
jgi:hypothetical protein